MFRLHIDVPLGTDEGVAQEEARMIVNTIHGALLDLNQSNLITASKMQYRLLQDGDRNNANLLLYDEESGRHLSKKVVVEL